MHSNILIKHSEKSWSKKELDKRCLHPGRKQGKPHGSFVIDLADLRKMVLLCPGCNNKFDYKRHKFRKEKEFPEVIGKCDACRTIDMYCSMYIAEELYTQARSTAEDRRNRHRTFWKDRLKQG
jgi:hypothetical protein